jgi:predicted nucleic acid-binding protein
MRREELIGRLASQGVAVSIISYMEAFQGLKRQPDSPETQVRFHELFSSISVIQLSKAVARRCTDLREALKQQGKRVNQRALDLMIAATALEYNLILVSRNLDDYRDIPGLQLSSPEQLWTR